MEEQIVYKSVDELIPYINNPRNNDQAVDAVASSINNFGFKVPIVVDGDNEIVNGHTRLKAAKKLGLTEVPVIVADDLTEEQIRAFRLADNKVSELAEWDNDLLLAELEELNEIDMTLFSFEETLPDVDIDGLFEEYEPEERVEDKQKHLTWNDKKVEINDVDIEILDNKYHEFYSLDLTISFVEWLAGE